MKGDLYMKSKITCSVINDLLPLYADNAVSSDSRALVEEHLEECKFCREELSQMKSTLVIEKDSDEKNIHKMKQRLSIKQLRVITAAALVIIVALIIAGITVSMTIYTGGSSLAAIQTLIFASVDIMAILTVTLGWILSFHYYSHIRFSENKSALKRFRRTAVISFASLFCVFSLVTVGFKLFFYGYAPNSDNINVITEFQYSDDSYLNQEWVFHLATKDGKPVNTFSQNTFNKESSTWNVNIYIREIPFKGVFEASGYTGGYSYADCEAAPSEDFNYTITLIYKDKTEVYDMRKEGLFKKQENVKYTPQATETPDSPTGSVSRQDLTARTAGDLTAVYDE